MGWLIDMHVDDIASGQALLAQHCPDVHPRWRDLCARQHVSPYSATLELDSNQQKQVNHIFDIFACGPGHIPSAKLHEAIGALGFDLQDKDTLTLLSAMGDAGAERDDFLALMTYLFLQ